MGGFLREEGSLEAPEREAPTGGEIKGKLERWVERIETEG